MARGGAELKLLGTWASPFVLRAQLALSFKGLTFENVEEDLRKKSDLLLTSNPVHKAVPVLLHGGRPVCESLVIVQYVDEAFAGAAGPPLLPADPYKRAVARFWVAFIEDKLLAAWQKVFTAKTDEEKAEWMKQTLAAVDVLEGGLKECSKGGSFFGGDHVGYVDIVLGGAVPWVHATEVLSGARLFDAGKVPLLAAWLERFGTLKEAKAVMPDVQRLVEHAKMKQPEAVAAGAAGDNRMAGGGDELKLLGTFGSPFVLRVKLALSFKGLSFEDVEEDLANKSELLLASNPAQKKVPVLIHNGKPVCDSQVIVQYIDEVFSGTGPSLLPADPSERAVARFWAAYMDDKLLASWLQAARGKTEEEKTEGLKQTFAAVETMEAAFKTCSKGKPFFGGDSVGYLDVTLGALVAWVHAGAALYGMRLFDDAKSPLLAAWVERFGALDAVKAVLPDVDRLVEFAKMKQAQTAAAATAN
ncbi:uncharacterized protein LOC124646633 [Lolium rigidum]|uniref:uncharacterized protein LOC124646633 n=1 Tax=Lolium rigidum TaxID=89674 RepID=UPI001F5D0226|nr:uncharacterized protein LOC124646633 [Lolium rigidum]